MDIQNITQTEDGYSATIDGAEMSVPVNDANRHYRAVLAAIDGGAPVADGTVADQSELRARINQMRDHLESEITHNGVVYQLDPISKQKLLGACLGALLAVQSGTALSDVQWQVQGQDFVWFAKDNTAVTMAPQDLFAFGLAAAVHVSAITSASRALKSMDPIPQDYDNAAYWP